MICFIHVYFKYELLELVFPGLLRYIIVFVTIVTCDKQTNIGRLFVYNFKWHNILIKPNR